MILWLGAQVCLLFYPVFPVDDAAELKNSCSLVNEFKSSLSIFYIHLYAMYTSASSLVIVIP